MNSQPKDQLLTPREVHAEYGFSPQTLANWRWLGNGPSYIKTTAGKSGRIKYRRSAIESWLKEQSQEPTAAPHWTPQGRLDLIKDAYLRWDNDELSDAELGRAIGEILYPR